MFSNIVYAFKLNYKTELEGKLLVQANVIIYTIAFIAS